jgi:hypothetical protein
MPLIVPPFLPFVERSPVTGPVAFLAGMTRVMGWTLVLPLMWEARSQRKHGPVPLAFRSLAAIAPPLALSLYIWSVGMALSKPTAFFAITESVWKQGAGWPWRAFTEFFNGPMAVFGWRRSLIDLAFTLAFLGLAVWAFRLRPAYGLYALAAIAFPVMSGTLNSMPRYAAIVFPAYIVLAQWANGHRWRILLLMAASALMAAFAATRFVTWHWIA